MISLLVAVLVLAIVLWIVWLIPFPPGAAQWIKPVVMLIVVLFALLYFFRGSVGLP